MSNDNLQGAIRTQRVVRAWRDRPLEERAVANPAARRTGLAAVPSGQVVSMADQLARDIADIEKATAALRTAEPLLEAWPAESARADEPRKPLPVWLLIAGIWISA